MALAHKDYEKAAVIFKDHFHSRGATSDSQEAVAELVHDFADWFESDNDRFDRERFLDAVNLPEFFRP